MEIERNGDYNEFKHEIKGVDVIDGKYKKHLFEDKCICNKSNVQGIRVQKTS